MHSSWFFRVKPIARLIFKARIFPEAVQFPTNPYYSVLPYLMTKLLEYCGDVFIILNVFCVGVMQEGIR